MALKDIDLEQLTKDMVSSFSTTLQANWPDVRPIAEEKAQELVRAMLSAEEMGLTDEEARIFLDAQRRSMRTGELLDKGIDLLAFESAINAALEAVKPIVNTAIGFPLIG
jgi:hypothetical protein